MGISSLCTFPPTLCTVGEPGADQFFVHFWSEVGVEEFPGFVMFVKSISPLGVAMFFDSVLFLYLYVGEQLCFRSRGVQVIF